MKRKIIKIDESKCNGCSLCVPDCAEGALQIIDGKARLVSDLFCDGLGACIGSCPQNAITIEEREAEPYNERKVMELNIIPLGINTIKAHLEHLQAHNATEYLTEAVEYLKEKGISNPVEKKTETTLHSHICPGSRQFEIKKSSFSEKKEKTNSSFKESELINWPIQLHLISPNASYLKNSDITIIADCVAYAYANTHSEFIKNRVTIIGCPKLDDKEKYIEKISQIIEYSDPKSFHIVKMEVPCCSGIVEIVKKAMMRADKLIPFSITTISIKGDIVDN